jgi:hypothetical protein
MAKKSPAGEYRRLRTKATDREVSPAGNYVEQLLDKMGHYSKPAAEAKRIIDRATGNLTDGLYETRRGGHE